LRAGHVQPPNAVDEKAARTATRRFGGEAVPVGGGWPDRKIAREYRAPHPNRISDDMITGLLIALAVCAGLAALSFAAASGISLQPGDQSRAILTGGLAIGLLAVALALMWWAHP